jgi:hypothetical protein
MSRILSLLILAIVWIIVCVAVSGCIAPATPATEPRAQQENASVRILSNPSGAELFLDGIFRGLTPATCENVSSGIHSIDLTMTGYNRWSGSFTITGGKPQTIMAELISTEESLPITTIAPAALPDTVSEIYVDGYWEYPQGRVTTENPVPLVVHTEAFNTGSATASEVMVSANMYYMGRMICWNTIYLGTLAGGGHVSRDSLVSCTLPLPLPDNSLDLKFENIMITG